MCWIFSRTRADVTENVRTNEVRMWGRWMLHMELCSCSSTILGQRRCTDRCSWVPCSLQEGFSCKCYSLALLDSNQIREQQSLPCCLLNSQSLLCPIPQQTQSARLLACQSSASLWMCFMWVPPLETPAVLVFISYIFAKVSWEN